MASFSLASVACSGSTTSDLSGPGPGTSSGGTSSGGTSSGGPDTPPAVSFAGEARGCSNLFVYRASADGAQFITIDADRDKLGLKLGNTRTIDLAAAPAGVTVGVDVFARPPTEARYCTDLRTDNLVPTPWRAEAGTLVIELGENADANGSYRATIRLRDVRLVGPERGTSVLVPKVELENVLVGWLPG